MKNLLERALPATFVLTIAFSSYVFVPGALVPQTCPTGGVLDGERAYFGSTLGANVCSAGSFCEDIYFWGEQRFSTAVCRAGRWVVADPDTARHPECPEHVFANGEIWRAGEFTPNVCDETTAPACSGAVFMRLPGGGSGASPAVCRDGQWQAGEDDGGSSAARFRLVRVANATVLERYLERGLEVTYGEPSPWAFGPATIGGPSGVPGDGGGGGGLSVPVSETNVQVEGVDEADRIKSDGETLFVLKNHQTRRLVAPESRSGNWIRVLALDSAAASASEIGLYEVSMREGQVAKGLYLRADSDQLVVTASGYGLDYGFWYSPLAWQGGSSTVTALDVSTPGTPARQASLEIEGEIVSSRRIGGVLYLAMRFHPHITDLAFFEPGAHGAAAELARIESASLSDLTPAYRRVDAAHRSSPERSLVNPFDCYLPNENSPIRSADVISLVAIDLDAMEVSSSVCFVGASETLYVSLENMYLASTRYDYRLVPGETDEFPAIDYSVPTVETDVHKFALAGGAIRYQASGVVSGHLGWNIERKPFRMSESGADLRVVTYTNELTADQSPVALTVLRDVGSAELEEISRLPNAAHPEPIGKPGELLYATRFVGDRAYFVTFLITDPLYVVDLSDPEEPFVAGELEITGYSDYLHPIEGGFLVGVGKDAIPDPRGDFRGAWYQGVKVSLYDVRDPARPAEVDALVLGKRGSETPVLSTHRAFTFLPGSDERRPRFALGARIHERGVSSDDAPWTHYGWSKSALELFEVDVQGGALIHQGEMTVEEYDLASPDRQYPIFGDDRSVLAGEAIFYIHGDDVFTAFWSQPEAFSGPE